MIICDEAFFQREAVVAISHDLIGMILCSEMNGNVTGGRIVETEAYGGITDCASHAYGGGCRSAMADSIKRKQVYQPGKIEDNY
jgi:3-methyladenine DNA glycosylase Mpg